MDAFMKDVPNVKPVLLKQNALEMDPFQQRLFNSQRETDFLLNLFCLTQCPQVDAFMKDGLNVKPVLLKQNAPEMDAFQQRLFVLSVKPIFC